MSVVLYLSDTGLLEPLGQSQILSYLRRLAAGRRIILLSLEKHADLADRDRVRRFYTLTDAAGIRWVPLRYHRRPRLIASLFDATSVLAVAAWLCVRERVHIVHARGFVPAVWALMLKRLFGMGLLFDTRGLSWVEQRVEIGSLRQDSMALRIARSLESRVFHAADAIVALSPAAAEAMSARPEVRRRPGRVRVITTCTDLELFRPSAGSRSTEKPRPLTVGYVGNAGAGYLFEPVLDFYLAVRRRVPDVRLKIVNRNDHAHIRACLNRRGLDGSSVEVGVCDYRDVPEAIRQMDVGVFFYRWPKGFVPPVFTRMGEFLACGIPCVSNVAGLGTSDILRAERVGVVVDGLHDAAIDAAATSFLQLRSDSDLFERCAASAARHFSLDAGATGFAEIYDRLEGGLATPEGGIAASME